MTTAKLPWRVRVWLWLTDWCYGYDHRPSYPKLMGIFVFWGSVAPAPFHPLPVLTASALLAFSFGYKAWADWVSHGSWNLAQTASATVSAALTRTETITASRVEQILAQRAANGFDASRPEPDPEMQATS